MRIAAQDRWRRRQVGWPLIGLAALAWSQAQAAPQPVNPQVQVTSYRCRDGQTVVAGYPDAQTAVVTVRNHAYNLKLARSASGARYTGYGLQWWVRGPHAALAPLRPGEAVATRPGVDCTATATERAARRI
jgi:membrane-bound inhibitor of C-type lysozyme